jgi:hypothetical protein
LLFIKQRQQSKNDEEQGKNKQARITIKAKHCPAFLSGIHSLSSKDRDAKKTAEFPKRDKNF